MNYRSYLAQDVRHLEVKFKDGTKTNLKTSSNNKIVVMKVTFQRHFKKHFGDTT
jgi:hypothetical protein